MGENEQEHASEQEHGRPLPWRLAAAVAGLALVAGLGLWWIADDAPLGEGGGFGLCMPVTAGSSVTLGEVPLRNRGDSSVTVTEVRLVRPRNVELIDAVILPIEWEGRGYTLVGSPREYPPASATNWDQRVEAVGARIQPSLGDPLVYLVLGLRARSDPGVTIDQDGTFEGVELRYRSGLRSYKYRVESDVRLRVISETCDDDQP